MSVNQRVRELRGLLNIKDFAEKLEVSPQLVSSIESGSKNLSIKMANKLSALFNVSVDWLYNGEKEKPKPDEESNGLKEVPPEFASIMSKYVQVLEENSRLKDQLLEKQKQELESAKNIKVVSK